MSVMAVQVYTMEGIKVAIMHSTGYFFQLLAKFAMRITLDKELKGLKVSIPIHIEVHERDLRVVEFLECPFVDIIRGNIEDIGDAQERFILINGLNPDAVMENDEGFGLSVDLAEYFLVFALENLIDDIFTDVDALYLNLIYMLHLLAYLLYYEQIDMDSKEFEGYWHYTIDEKVFHFKDCGDQNISLIFKLIGQMYDGKHALARLWYDEK